MMRRRLAVTSLVLVALMGAPRAARGGVLDVIWEMSGPRMIGAGVYCKFARDYNDCRVVALKVAADAEKPKVWFAAEVHGYVSVPHNGFGWGDAYMIAAEPLVEGAWANFRGGRFYSGVGATYDFLFGSREGDPGSTTDQHFDAFQKLGIKFKPVAYERPTWGLQYDLRLYPDEFGADQFTKPSTFAGGDRPHEWVQGFSVTLKLW